MEQVLARVRALLQESTALVRAQPAEAAARFQDAFDLCVATPGLERAAYRELAPQLAQLYIAMAEYRRAGRLLTGALEAAFAHGADPAGDDVLTLRNSLASARLMDGDAAAARAEFERVLAARRAATPPDAHEIARTLNNLSRACALLGRDGEAQRAIEEAVAIMRAHAADGDPVLTAALHNLAVAQMEAGHLEAALHGFECARRSAEAAGATRTPECASILHEFARACGAMLRYDEAHEAARAAFVLRHELLGAQHPDTGAAFRTAGALLRDSGDHAQALRAFRSAYQTFLALHGLGHPETVEAMCDMMTAARRAPENDDVGPDLQNMADFARSMGADDNPILFRLLTDLAAWRAGTSHGPEAASLAAEALAVFRTLRPMHDATLASHYRDLARLLETQSAAAEARALHVRAARADDGLAARLVQCRDGRLKRALATRLAEGTAAVVRLLVDHLPDDPGAAADAFALVASRKGLFAEALLAHDDRRLVARQPDLAPLFAELAEREAELATTQMAGPVDGWRKLLVIVDRLRDRIREIHGAIEFATRFEHRVAPALASVTAEEIASRLAPGAALVEFYALPPAGSGDDTARRILDRSGDAEWLLPAVVPDRYVAFVIAAGAAPRLVDLGSGADLGRLVFSWLVTIGNGAGDLVPRERERDRLDGPEPDLSRQLRTVLFDPLRPALGSATTIFVAPDGVLCRVPFAALLDEGEPGARLVERFTFTTMPSSRAFAEFGTPVSGSNPPFVLGDPDFDLAKPGAPPPAPPPVQAADFYFARLPGTGDEAWRVASLVGGRRVTSKQAHEAAVRQLRSPAILHLATHGYYVRPFADGLMVVGNWREQGGDWGFLSRRQVLGFGATPFTRSGLVLAGANAWTRGHAVPSAVGDGLLTAAEIAQLDLRETELVVLSACSTALGDVAPGTAVAGLLYGFRAAGARTTMAAMWPIPDEATVAIMEGLYRAALSGAGRAEALRHAQLALVRRGAPPWHWAAYVCCGDPGPMQFRAPADQP